MVFIGTRWWWCGACSMDKGGHTGNQTGEEGLVAQVGVVLLEVLLGGSDELDSGELETAVLEAGDDGSDEAALETR